jgi:hypothetical protein
MGVLVALGAGTVVGMRLGAVTSRPAVREVRLDDAASMPTSAIDGSRSAGGFTGFGGSPSLQGDVLRTGIVSAVGDGELVLIVEGATMTVEYTQPGRLYRLAPAGRVAKVGDTVVVSVDGERATGVLITSLGDASSGTP